MNLAQTDRDLERCFPVMRQLRPHLELNSFIAQVRRQEKQGYHVGFLETNGRVTAVAGFRWMEKLSWGRILFVDDLVTDETQRSKGHGGELFDALVSLAKSAQCQQLHLDSGVQRFRAHRFYLTKGMDITCHHFGITLSDLG